MREPTLSKPLAGDALFAEHSRAFESNRFVYPVISRRSGGLSIGVNLNPDKICNFDCIYCQVDRRGPVVKQAVDLDRLQTELESMIELFLSGGLFRHAKFRQTPANLRRLRDIALSGDGEPTTCRNFAEAVKRCAQARAKHGLSDAKIVLITNATMFHRPEVQRGLQMLDESHGEIWAKLDAGTEAYYDRVARTSIGFERVLTNITDAARQRPIVIQALFMRIEGHPPPPEEQEAFCQRLNEILAAGGRIKLVQVHTIARNPAESWVEALSRGEVDHLAGLIRQRTGLEVAAFYGLGD
jgi:wyosine [tRNA(Phe)-imidazoG37] synthetase (radical SAM superfamily)